MNNSDQGVFPLDTAFKRRWFMEYIPLNGRSRDQGVIEQSEWNPEIEISKVKIKWQTLRKEINKYLLTSGQIESDRLLGPFFLTQIELQQWERSIPNKLLSYLRSDVLRFEPSLLFKCDDSSLGNLQTIWRHQEIFVDSIQDDLYAVSTK